MSRSHQAADPTPAPGPPATSTWGAGGGGADLPQDLPLDLRLVCALCVLWGRGGEGGYLFPKAPVYDLMGCRFSKFRCWSDLQVFKISLNFFLFFSIFHY